VDAHRGKSEEHHGIVRREHFQVHVPAPPEMLVVTAPALVDRSFDDSFLSETDFDSCPSPSKSTPASEPHRPNRSLFEKQPERIAFQLQPVVDLSAFGPKMLSLAAAHMLVEERDVPFLLELSSKELEQCRFVPLTRCWVGDQSLYKAERFAPSPQPDPANLVLHCPIRCESVDFEPLKCFCPSHLRRGTETENKGKVEGDTVFVAKLHGSNRNSELYRPPAVRLADIAALFLKEQVVFIK
jgi:hypothetical protein